MKDIYRKSVLDKLSNPEQLDKALKITSPLSWLALIAIALVIVATGIWSVKGTIPVTVTASGIVAPANVGTSSIYSSVTGTDVLLVKNAGEFVKEGDVVATALESRSAERREIKADQTGVVSDDVLVKNGASVEQGSEIMRLSPMVADPQGRIVVCYVPVSEAQNIKRGMKVYVNLTSADSQKYGHMTGRVVNVDSRATTMAAMNKVLGADNNLSATFTQSGAVCAVTCELYPDQNTVSGFAWSNEKGKKLTVANNAMCTVKIIVEEVPPISKFLTKVNEVLGGK